jgi:hypothetical protein
MDTFKDMDYKQKYDYLRSLLKVGAVFHYRAPFLKGNPEYDVTVTGLTKKQITYIVSGIDKTFTKHPSTFCTDLVDGYQSHT